MTDTGSTDPRRAGYIDGRDGEPKPPKQAGERAALYLEGWKAGQKDRKRAEEIRRRLATLPPLTATED